MTAATEDHGPCAFCGDVAIVSGERVSCTFDHDGLWYHPSCLSQKVNYRSDPYPHVLDLASGKTIPALRLVADTGQEPGDDAPEVAP